mmetsp:Transcript_18827/g.47069  ORF Transcript_18827/g.47069 Transcript_18827/m.47069 type:complete len:296 (-) Transcript_18827:498-1385(-)
MLYRLLPCDELEKFDCVAKIHFREDDTHELDYVEIVGGLALSEPCPTEDTVEWNEEAIAELSRGVRRAVSKEFKPEKGKVPKDMTLQEPMARVKRIWESARSGVPLYYGPEKCAAPLLRAGKSGSHNIEVKFFIQGTPEIDPHVEKFEIQVFAFDFTSSPSASSSAANANPTVQGQQNRPAFVNWELDVSDTVKKKCDVFTPTASAANQSGGRGKGTSSRSPDKQKNLQDSGSPVEVDPNKMKHLIFTKDDIKGTDRSYVIEELRSSRVHFVRMRGCTKRWQTDWSEELKMTTLL